MAIRTKRFPEYDLSLFVISGAHSCEEAVGFFEGLGPADATRWLTYCGPTSDMSAHHVACLPRLKRTIAAKQEELFGAEPKPGVVVCRTASSEAFFEFWRSFIETGEPHAPAPRLFSTLKAACEWLGLPETAREAVIEAARDQAARPQPPLPDQPSEPAPAPGPLESHRP